ncbi:SusC/RagA family TonB-linked outer membrane protein [Pedobacter frigidisoli]|uniref:SusC/RagA family TonB-linked outer membrane protein n=1 Tax=Pedobacter frigidisoli TaxID=2530455 RepID=A0A4R0NIH5_9SPHI|nr:SusC/RagA family TonB-linked outer membrane protein [Pedobacter frigidisoli]TCD00029.1 SusC/RagA family TonB-linked outer membrane protein [Pedobacter frigidisoli]
MKKLLQSLFIFLCLATAGYAQDRTITGTVTAQEDNLPLPGVSVKIKGTQTGTVTSASGKFTITAATGSTLVFTYIGYKVKEATVGSSSVINASLENDANQLTEVVVTGAYGTKQTARSQVTNTQSLSGEKLNTVRSTNINNALAGKVAGIQVRSQSAAALGRNTAVRLRGAGGFGTGSGALYVVDGTILPNADDVNLDDIEDVSVLQGPAAAALLGSQAASGAILITTKKGKSTTGSGITLNLGAIFEDAYILPNYQNSYAGGNTADMTRYTWKSTDPVAWKALDGKYYPNYSDDSSWGPRMVGQEYIPWYAWYPGTDYSYKTASLTPNPDNARDFFQTGVTFNNSVSYTASGDKYNAKMTYGNQNTQGLIPNSSLVKNTFNFNSSYDLNKHFTVSANINYVKTILNGEINDGYSNLTTGSFSQWFHRDIDMNIMKELRGLTVPGLPGETIYASWNHSDPTSYDPSNPKAFYGGNYWYNPYSYTDLISQKNQRDRLYGNVAFTYKVNSDLKFTATYRKQQNTTFTENKARTELETSGNQTGFKGSYFSANTYSNRENYEVLGMYTKKIKDFTIDATAGTDIFKGESNYNQAGTNNGLSIPNLFTVNNSVDAPSVANYRQIEKYRALLARATVGYKDMVFLDGSIRNDWFSTLPSDHSGVLSKSIGASFVFTELLPKEAFGFLSEGKIRASYGEIPQALGTTNDSFGAYRYPGFAYGVNALKFNGNLLQNTPDALVDPDIRGAVAQSSEVGLDLKLFKRKISISATYWDKTETNYPRSVGVNAASGFSSILTNVGKITSNGLEFQLTASPVTLPNFSWTLSATYANLLSNKVVEVSDKYKVTRISVESVWGTTMPIMIHEAGYEWGQIWGNGKKRNADGVPLLDGNGHFVNDPNVYFGSVLPKHTGGLQNSFTLFKMIDINANIDYQVGGKFVSLSNQWGAYSGVTERTAGINDKGNPVRDKVADGGGVRVDGVDQTTGQAKTYYLEAQDYYQGLYNSKTFDDYIYDLTFIKLREVSIGYRIPVQKLGIAKFVQNATFSVVARNPVLIYAKTKDFDPSEISATSGETSQLPGTRGFGFNLRIGF